MHFGKYLQRTFEETIPYHFSGTFSGIQNRNSPLGKKKHIPELSKMNLRMEMLSVSILIAS